MPLEGGYHVTTGIADTLQDKTGTGAGAMPSAPITLGFWAALLLSGLSGLKHTRRRFLKGPLMSQGLGAQSPEAGARRRPSRADTEKTYCRARSLFSWGRNL